MQFFFSTRFSKEVERYFTPTSIIDLLRKLSESPAAGKLLQGFKGIRKLRFPDRIFQKGQRGGLRVVYRYNRNSQVILLYFAYRKTDQSDILPHQRDYILNVQITDFFESVPWKNLNV